MVVVVVRWYQAGGTGLRKGETKMEHRLLATVRHIREKMDAHQLNWARFEAIGYEAFKAEEAAMEAEYTVAREALWAHHDKIR